MSLSKRQVGRIVVIAATSLCILIFLFVSLPFLFRYLINIQTNLVEKSFLYPFWRDLPIPIYKRLYFFNITNAEDFLYNGTAMRVEEVGPYVYVGNWKKEEIQWSKEGTVNYREVKTFHFSLEESVGSEEDMIYTMNAPYIAASEVLREFGSTIRKTANNMLMSYELIINKSIRELAFGGYEDPIMDVSKYYQWNSPFSSGSFAWLYGHNATDEGDFDVFTGETDHSLLNVIEKWNGYKDLNFWRGRYCNMINGTNGEFHAPLVDQDEYTFFQPLVCRSITFRYSAFRYYKGIPINRYENKDDIFSKDNPDNYCFQIDPDLKSGVLDVSNCWYGAPVVLSFPHFYLADSSFLENVTGLSPNKNDHGSHIAAEPVTGVTVDLSIKFQMNLKLKPLQELKAFENVSSGVYPVFWLEIKVQLPDNLIEMINHKIFLPQTIIFLIILFVYFFCAFVWCYYSAKKDKMSYGYYEETKPLLKNDSKSNLFVNSFDSNKSSLAVILHSHDNAKRQNSFGTYHSISSSEFLYQSYSAEENSDDSTHVDVLHSKNKKRKERMSFKDARTLTMI